MNRESEALARELERLKAERTYLNSACLDLMNALRIQAKLTSGLCGERNAMRGLCNAGVWALARIFPRPPRRDRTMPHNDKAQPPCGGEQK